MTPSSAADRRRFLIVQGMTVVRVPLALIFAGLLFLVPSTHGSRVVGTWLLALIELSDILDGQLARLLKTVTEWGAILDPYADSVSRITVYWALAASPHFTAARQFTAVVIFLPWVMAFRDITVSYCRIIWARHGQSGSARWSGKIKAVVQGTGAFFLLLSPTVFSTETNTWLLPAMAWAVLLVTLASLVEYLAQAIQVARPTYGTT